MSCDLGSLFKSKKPITALGMWKTWSQMRDIRLGTEQKRMKPSMNILSSIIEPQNITDWRSNFRVSQTGKKLTMKSSALKARSN